MNARQRHSEFAPVPLDVRQDMRREPVGRGQSPRAACSPPLRRPWPTGPSIDPAHGSAQRSAGMTLTELDRTALSIGLNEARKQRGILGSAATWIQMLCGGQPRPLANARLDMLRRFAIAYAQGEPQRAIELARGIDAETINEVSAYCAARAAKAARISDPQKSLNTEVRDIPGWALVIVILTGLFVVAL